MKPANFIKRLALLVCCSLAFITSKGKAADTPTSPEKPVVADTAMAHAVERLGAAVAGMEDSLQKATDTLRQLRSDIYGGKILIDSSALEYFRANPDSLYRHSFLVPVSNPADVNGLAKLRYGFSIVLMLLMLFIGVRLSYSTALCRDVSYDENHELRPVRERPFSFARVQLLWWTLIILCNYAFFFGATGILLPPNATAGILLGFGAIVYAGGKVIDDRQIKADGAGQRIQDRNAKCEGFFTDILSDDNGISIHRFQAMIFNVIFGVGFISFFVSALGKHIYPFADFSEWQFGLLGISSATYLAMKATENNPQTTGQQAASQGEESERNPNLF